MSDKRDDVDAGEQEPKKFVPLEAIARVELDCGRWVVYLNVQSWQPNENDYPVVNNWKRINDYSTEQEAKVAATWFEKSANRTIRPPTGF